MKKLLSIALVVILLLTLFACGKAYVPVPNPPLALGEKYLFDLDYEQAILQFDQAIQIDPKNPRPWVGKYIVDVLNPADPDNPVVPKYPGMPRMPDFPKLPNDPSPAVFFPPIIEWCRENWPAFAEKLLELLKNRWPALKFEPEATTAAAEATTMMARETTTTDKATSNTVNANATTKPATASKSGVTEDDIRKAIQNFNNINTMGDLCRCTPIDYEKYVSLLSAEEKQILFVSPPADLKIKWPTSDRIEHISDEAAPIYLRELKNELFTFDEERFRSSLLDVENATDLFISSTTRGAEFIWIVLDGKIYGIWF